jgi:Fe-S-cluster-containing hydrogenase component 2
MEMEGLEHDKDRCRECGRCTGYCPLGHELPLDIGNDACIKCLYCFCVCPERAIGVKGKLGFMEEQIRQYDEIIRKVTE